jgi:hypothetical protein
MWLFILIPLVFNIWFRRVLNTLETIGGVIHVIFFFVNIITLTVLAKRSSTDFVFKTLTHDISGWSNPGVAFGLGLLTMTYPIAGMNFASPTHHHRNANHLQVLMDFFT